MSPLEPNRAKMVLCAGAIAGGLGQNPRMTKTKRSDGKRRMGVEVGATLAKLVSQEADGPLQTEILPAGELTRISEQIHAFAPVRIGLTGGGASRLEEALEIDSVHVNEFDAWGAGAHLLLDEAEFPADSRFLMVSLGTGTSVLLVDSDSVFRIGGTSLGGGTVLGLGAALVGEPDFDALCELAAKGSRSEVDLVVSDIYRPGEIELPGDITAAAFGKLSLAGTEPHYAREDLAAGIMSMVAENVGLIAAGLSFTTQVERIVYGGSTLRNNPNLTTTLDAITKMMGRTAHFLPLGEVGGAVGALAAVRAG